MNFSKKNHKLLKIIIKGLRKKQVLIPFLLFFLTINYAQTIKEIPEPDFDAMLKNIDKSNFTSGILYDKVIGIS